MGGDTVETAVEKRAPLRSFGEFYAFYLAQHADRTCRRLHFVGASAGWVGHFFFEKNRPATFRHPFYSFAGDWVMWKQILTGRIRF